MRNLRLSGGVLLLVAALALGGCGSDDESDATAPTSPASSGVAGASSAVDPDASPSADPSYLPVPDGVELSPQGSDLGFASSATVAWQPRQDVVGALDVSVDAVERTTLKRSFVGWKVPKDTRTGSPYFVRATITNRGESDLSGDAVPLYLVGAANTLIEATTFASTFKPCRTNVLPEAFAPGATAQVCLVYFVPAPGDFTGVSFRPTEDFAPITWAGDVTRAKKPGKPTS